MTPSGGFEGRQSRWGDRQSWTLEERLPHLFHEIELRIVLAAEFAVRQHMAAERAAEARRHAQEERERRWHELMVVARERLVQEHRVAALSAQVTAWQTAEQLRKYCDALEAAHGEHPDTAALLVWAREHVRVTDPTSGAPPALPTSPEPTAEALQPFLPPGWSAYGPGRR